MPQAACGPSRCKVHTEEFQSWALPRNTDQFKVPAGTRIAMLMPPEHLALRVFIEAFTANRGFKLRVFADEEAAIVWLTEPPPMEEDARIAANLLTSLPWLSGSPCIMLMSMASLQTGKTYQPKMRVRLIAARSGPWRATGQVCCRSTWSTRPSRRRRKRLEQKRMGIYDCRGARRNDQRSAHEEGWAIFDHGEVCLSEICEESSKDHGDRKGEGLPQEPKKK